MATVGTSIVSFGAAPGTNHATVAVAGQTTILATSYVEAFIMGIDSTATHNSYEHLILPMAASINISDLVAGTGFTINILTELRLTGTFSVRWVWT